mmetsp:Transcript_36037/g.92835  ORF Transcript_36037/g.92835 Transcript_36037/m.92835 type:complete len:306 (-) Transcript_36037:1281-2198(-)
MHRPSESDARHVRLLNVRDDVSVDPHHALTPLGECGREEIREELLDEGEDQHVANRRQWNDQDDQEGDHDCTVLDGPLYCPHLPGLQRVVGQRSLAEEAARILQVLPEQVRAIDVEREATLHLLVGPLQLHERRLDALFERLRFASLNLQTKARHVLGHIISEHAELLGVKYACEVDALLADADIRVLRHELAVGRSLLVKQRELHDEQLQLAAGDVPVRHAGTLQVCLQRGCRTLEQPVDLSQQHAAATLSEVLLAVTQLLPELPHKVVTLRRGLLGELRRRLLQDRRALLHGILVLPLRLLQL